MGVTFRRAETRNNPSGVRPGMSIFRSLRLSQLLDEFKLSCKFRQRTGLLSSTQKLSTCKSPLWGVSNMEKNTAKKSPENDSAAVAEPPEERCDEMAAREARVAADRLLALLEPFESVIPRSDFIFIADCHDTKRRITPSRLAKLRIIARAYTNGGAGDWISRNRGLIAAR